MTIRNDLRILQQENGLGEKRYVVVGAPWVKGEGTTYGTFAEQADAEALIEEVYTQRAANAWDTVGVIKPNPRRP